MFQLSSSLIKGSAKCQGPSAVRCVQVTVHGPPPSRCRAVGTVVPGGCGHHCTSATTVAAGPSARGLPKRREIMSNKQRVIWRLISVNSTTTSAIAVGRRSPKIWTGLTTAERRHLSYSAIRCGRGHPRYGRLNDSRAKAPILLTAKVIDSAKKNPKAASATVATSRSCNVRIADLPLDASNGQETVLFVPDRGVDVKIVAVHRRSSRRRI